MKRIQLNAEQQFLAHYLSQTHHMILVHSQNYEKMKVPICVAVTPFPRGLPSPPLLPYNFATAPACARCRAKATHRYVHCPDNRGWLCPLCNHKTLYTDRHPSFRDSPQVQALVWEGFSCPVDTPWEAEIAPVRHRNDDFLLVLELSELSRPIYVAVLDRLREKVASMAQGRFSIFVLNRALQYPLVRGHRFALALAPDLEDFCPPPMDCVLFDLETDRELFLKYIAHLRDLKPQIVLGSMLSVIKALNAFCASDKIPVVLLTSLLAIDESEAVRSFVATQVFRPTTHFDIFVIRPPVFIPDYGPMSDLTLFLNARIHFCDLSQYAVLPDEIIASLFELKLIDVIIYCLPSAVLKVADILGPGVRRAEKQFALTSICTGDTVYFYFEYNIATIKFLAPGVQFQVRYFDALGRRVIRQMTATFTLVDNMYSCATNVNYDVYIAGTVMRAIEKNRENTEIEAVHAALRAAKVGFLDNTLAMLFLLQTEKLVQSRVEQALKKSAGLLSREALSQVMGKCPSDIAAFVAPLAYRLALGAEELEGPFTIGGRKLQRGAWYVVLPGGHGVVLLAPGEDADAWAQAVNVPPLQRLIASVCHETIVEILTPAASATHPLYVHIHKCICD
jgi:DNA-directed RNA polymerase subunit RPC12/RpoP